MISCFPEIYEDELIYSWFCRYHVHSGYMTHKAALKNLYCKRSDNPSKEFIGNIRPEVRKLISELIPMKKLILDHTMFPQYARFISREDRDRAMKILCREAVDAHTVLPIPQRKKGDEYMRFCPVCVEEDRAFYGETFWHRSHQLRGMKICPRHKCRLVQSEVPAQSQRTYVLKAAEDYVPDDAAKVFCDDEEELLFSEYLLDIFHGELYQENVSAVLYEYLGKEGYLKRSGKSRYVDRLVRDMKDYYQSTNISSDINNFQTEKILLGRCTDYYAICQIAFFLKIPCDELLKQDISGQTFKQFKDAHNTILAPDDWTVYDKEISADFRKTCERIYYGSDGKRPERVSERLLIKEMGWAGWWLPRLPACQEIYHMYEESYEESWCRKVVWAYRLLKSVDKMIYWSDIRKITGVKKEKISGCLQYMQKYCSQDEQDAIKNILHGDLLK